MSGSTLPDAASGEDAEVPSVFDEYRLIRRIGRGGMGEVWLAHDTLLDRPVAVKLLSGLAETPAKRGQFLMEARIAAQLSHPNVVTVHRVGVQDGQPFIVTERLSGKTVSEMDKPVPWREALRIGLGLARGLAAAHRAGILHCDIKPANVMVTESGEAKLLDFGIARFFGRARSERGASPDSEAFVTSSRAPARSSPPASGVSHADTRREPAPASLPPPPGEPNLELLEPRRTDPPPPQAAGTPRYMPPEIWRGEAPGPDSDVYQLGTVLFVLCSGRGPNDDLRTMRGFVEAIQLRDTPRLADRAPDVDPRLCKVIDACLLRERELRYRSAEELCQALEELSATGERPRAPEGNPYRGLAAFEAEHRALFFGRARETRAIVDRLRAQTLVLVAGGSGLGKSSICRAGVLPAVREGGLGDGRAWEHATMVPGDRPAEMLAAALSKVLSAGEIDGEPLPERILQEGPLFAREVRKALRRDRGLVLFIDQMEELCTLTPPPLAASFCGVLAALLRDVPGLRILGAVRGDFMAALASLPAMAEEVMRSFYVLRPLTDAQLREAIVAPAEALEVRFESEALVTDLVQSARSGEGGLPLLQFTLAELWEARERKGQVITRASLSQIGGVEGALSRHADGVIAALLPERRALAFEILTRLVTPLGTRARREEADLPGEPKARREVLDALVNGRLIHARDAGGSAEYDLSHEALIRGWGAFAARLDEEVGARLLRERVSSASQEWERLGRSPDALWGPRQLAEIAGLDLDALPPRDRAFVSAGARLVRSRKALRWGVLLALPVLSLVTFWSARLYTRAQVRARADLAFEEAKGAVREAERAIAAEKEAKLRAFAAFDGGDDRTGNTLWAEALRRTEAADAECTRAAQELESVLKLSPGHADAESLLGDILYSRAELAERTQSAAQMDELLSRMAVYDSSGDRARRWAAPGEVRWTIEPPGASVLLSRCERRRGESWPFSEPAAVPAGDRSMTLPQGSYLFVIAAEGYAEVRYPVIVGRAETRDFAVRLPRKEDVPKGFVYVPEGWFLQGASEEVLRSTYYETAPLHPVRTGAFFIARHETTFGEWMEFLRDLDPAARGPLLPRDASGLPLLSEGSGGSYTLRIRPVHSTYTAAEGEPVRYVDRPERAEQDWRKMPVGGIDYAGARAYAEWLSSTGRAPGARLCTEMEWERAARGADGRPFPSGEILARGAANIEDRYAPSALGPDEVGTHPASRSPFGIDDMTGNVWEWVVPWTRDTDPVRKGGSFRQPPLVGRAENRATHAMRDEQTGARICATPQR